MMMVMIIMANTKLKIVKAYFKITKHFVRFKSKISKTFTKIIVKIVVIN